MAGACAVPTISDLAAIGFPGMHIVMQVLGNDQTPVELQTFGVRVIRAGAALAALAVATACASLPPGRAVVARSRLGVVTGSQFAALLEEQLGYEGAGHFLARLEERREAVSPSFEDARPAVAEALAAERIGEAQQVIRAEMLRAIDARIYEERLARVAGSR